MPDFTLTVAICTHNRPEDLAECLDALYAQDLSGIQLIVVDSASRKDAQQAIVRATVGRANLQLIRLESPGLSAARNAAVEASVAPWLAFLDDDAIAAPDWVMQAKRLTALASPVCAVIGGRVDPLYSSGAVPEIGRRWSQLLSLIQDEGEDESNSGRKAVCGANVIFRRSPVKRIGSFPGELGRIGNVLLSGEEKLVIERLCEAGCQILYSDLLCVRHKIPKERLKREWAARRAYWDGVTDQKIRRLMRRPVSILTVAKIVAAIPLLGVLAPSRSPAHEFFIRFWYNVGCIRELLFPVRLHSSLLASNAPKPI
jgi:glycosyltransferase involved in cell wall biosynthesis